ncbi:MAG: choice-of-anchor J domain-containing protein, partial [Bergeyella zoohelcum]|nr:choice-of-anchor J domain-containing protein [Bergeyella zoohelcum]
GWTTQDINNDNSTWQKINSPGLSNSGSHLAANFPNNKAGSNDWLFSNPLKLKGNQPYRLSLYVSKFQNPEERLKIFLANQANSNATLTPLGTEIIAEADLEYHKYHYEFSVPNDQIAYIAFQNKTPNPTDQTYAIGIDDVHIQNPNAKPEVDFKADKVITNTFDAVAFKGNVLASASNPATYKWSFTPNSISYLNGTDQNSLNPVVKFNEEGTYSISLVATNSSGEVTSTKNNYIKVQNVNAKASFSNRNTTIYQKETIAFANTSTGNPRPSEFLWEITPNDGIEFISETNKNSENPVVKFNKEGVYSVSLKVTSGLNSDTYTRDSLITVNPTYLPVRDVKYELDNATGLVKLNWQKPVLSPIFYEDLDGVKREVYGNNANNDSFAWHLSNTGYNNTNALRSWSWQVQPLNADDWAVTSKIPAGAELLSFLVRHSEAERYDVYVVPATDTGKNPSLEELKNGNKVYTFEAESAQKDFVKKEIDIRNFTNKDFHIAFHHRTKKEDNGLAIIIDNIEVGFNNSLEQQSIGQQNIENIDFVGINKTEIVSSKEINNSTIKNLASDEEIEENGVLSLPRLTGYQVVRNSEVIKDITDVENKTYTDEIKSNGTYTYDVYAVYSDGDKSEKRTVTVEVVALSTDEVSADDRLKVYPNPSDGKFTIEAKFGVSKLDTQVYDMSGKLIFKKEYQGNK